MKHSHEFFHSSPNMGCAHSKNHPKNIDLVKLKKKYDAEPIKNAKLLNVWVIGADNEKSMELGKLISEEGGFLFVTQDSLLQKEVAKATERGEIIREILQDKGTVCPGIVLDLATEELLENLEGLKGVVFQGIPRDKRQAWHLQNLIRNAPLVIYIELPEDKLKSALALEGDEPATIKANLEHFQRSITQLLKHKQIIKVSTHAAGPHVSFVLTAGLGPLGGLGTIPKNVNGEEITRSLVNECIKKINDSNIL